MLKITLILLFLNVCCFTGTNAKRLFIKSQDISVYPDLIGVIRLCAQIKDVVKLKYYANQNKAITYSTNSEHFGEMKMYTPELWCTDLHAYLRNNDYINFYFKAILIDESELFTKIFNESRGPPVTIIPRPTPVPVPESETEPTFISKNITETATNSSSGSFSNTTDSVPEQETTKSNANMETTTISTTENDESVVKSRFHTDAENMLTTTTKPLSSCTKLLQMQMKLQQEIVNEMTQNIDKLKEDLEKFKDLYEAIYSLFQDGTRNSTKWLVITGRTPKNEDPILIVNEIIRDIVGVPLLEYKIEKIERINDNKIRFLLRNYGEKLKILANSKSKLNFTKFKIVDPDMKWRNNQ